MPEVVHHVALALALLGLAQAAFRIATRIAPSGLDRAIAALVIGVAIAVVEALALGLVALGTSPVALLAATGVVWAVTLAALPSAPAPPSTELLVWCERQDGLRQAGMAVVGGAYLAWVAWQLRFPSIGFDSSVYHYPDIAGWIANGRPGSMLDLSYDIPYGNYPLTDEVAQTWAAGIARSYIPIALWNPLMAVALAAGSWVTLRNLSLSARVAGLGTAALLATPLLVRQLNEPQTDLSAMAWLACTAGLATGARRRPALLVPALIAAGLGIGTKTTVAPATIAALVLGAYQARGRLKPLAPWLALGTSAAFVVGGVWYARNFAQHGSPLWPFVDAPWGDPSPRFLGLLNTTFLERPFATLDNRLGEYTALLGGGWLALLAAPLALIVGASARLHNRGLGHSLAASGALTVAGALIWSVSWGTGLQTAPEVSTPSGWPISTMRYLIPTIGLAIVAVGLATRVHGAVGRLATLLLLAVLAWSLVADAQLGTPYTPSAGTLLAGGLVGLLVLGLMSFLRNRFPERWPRPKAAIRAALSVAAAMAVGALLAPVSNGFIERSTTVVGSTAPAPQLVQWFVEQPGFDDEEWKIAVASRAVISSLAGDHFEHSIELVPANQPCRELARDARTGPLVVSNPDWFRGIIGLNEYSAPRCMAAHRPVFVHGDHAVYRLRG
jgi:hypothetical protein